MKKTNILFLLTLLMSMVGVTAFAHDISVKNADGVTIYYTWKNNQTELSVSYRGNSYSAYSNEYTGKVVIPESVTYIGKTYPVTSIGSSAFDGCTGLTSITIPNSVTSIGSSAFYKCTGLTSITIPNSVTSIGGSAFSGCRGLTSITIPNSVTSIGNYAFDGCMNIKTVNRVIDLAKWCENDPIKYGDSYSNPMNYAKELHLYSDANTEITDFVIPNGITAIRSNAFEYCSGLTSVTIPNSVTSIGQRAFSGCTGLTSIVIPSSVTSIGESAFYNCSGLTSVTIPNSVTSIGSSAFYGCTSLTSVTIPNSVTSIGQGAFFGCTELTSIEIPNSVTSIGSSAFRNCTNLTSVNIPSSVTSIDSYAFYKCTGLTSIEIPNSVTSIGSYAFSGCSGLQSVVIGNGVTNLPSYVFGTGEQLKSLTIGSGVLSIDSYVFRSSSSSKDYKPIKTIWLTNTPPTNYTVAAGTVNYVANNLYTSLNKNSTTVYPFLSSIFEVDGVKYVPVSPSERTSDAIDCRYSDEAANINIGETVSYKGVEMNVQRVHKYACYQNPFIEKVETAFNGDIEEYAFYMCDNVSQITLNNGGNIGEKTFADSKGLKSLEIGSNVTNIGTSAFNGVSGDFVARINNRGYIGQSAFADSKGLKSLEIDSNVTDIGTSAFNGVSGDFVARINNRGNIGQSAFADSKGLKSLEIGSNVTNLGNSVFNGCANMATAKLLNNGIVGENAFRYCTSMTTATLGDSITSLGQYVFDGCSKLESIVVPDAVTSMGAYAFRNCTSMKTAKIGADVQTINTYTFSGCSSLTDIEIGSNVKTIASYAFSNCESLPVIYIPRTVTIITDYVFRGCGSLKTVIMDEQESELTLGSNGSNPLFSDCPLDSVYIGRNITYPTESNYGYSPFYRNTSLRSVEITDKETEVSVNEFYGCTNLKNVKIGNGVTTIGDWAFSGCSSIDYFSFGSSVKTIGKEAFSDCTAMTKLMSYAAYPPTCGNQALDDINKWNCVLSIPQGYKTAYQQADQWKEFFFVNDDLNIDSYRLIYIVDGVEYKTINIECGATITAEAAPTQEGFTFSGWSEIPKTMPAKDVIVTGTFTINSYTLTYMIGSKEYKSYEMEYNSAIIPKSAPVKKGMTFSGWDNLPETMPAHDLTLTGTYSWSKKTLNCVIYQVTDTLNDYVSVIGYDEVNGDVIILPTVEIDGYNYIVNQIINSAFAGCSRLTSVTISDNVTSIGTSAFNGVPVYVKRGTKSLLTLWQTNYTPYETGTNKILECPTFKLMSTTQVTAIFQISNRYNEYTYTCSGDTIPGNTFIKEEKPQYESSVTFNIYLGDYQGYSKKVNYKTLPISPTANTIRKTASSLGVKGAYIAGDAQVVSQIIKINGVEYEGDEAFLSGLDPNTIYSVVYTISVAYGKNGAYVANYSADMKKISTLPISLTTSQPKVISSGNVIVAAETNVDDDETNVGFEWRCVDWTDEFPSSTGNAYLYEGVIEGYIKNLNTDKLWKFRPYYLSSSGTYYYGDWMGLDPANTSYFEPTVHTYSKVNVEGNTALVKGYALAGTENIKVQGFKYWKTTYGNVASRKAPVVPANAKTIEAVGQQIITATLADLEYSTTYHYVAFVTTEDGTTYYGEELVFTTPMDPTGINDVIADVPAAENVRKGVYTLTGVKLADELSELQGLPQGIYIVDGKKVILR